MIKLAKYILIFSLIIFASCSDLGIGSNTEKKDISGYGLEVDFDLDTSWISLKRIDYRLSLENTGVEPVELDRTRFKLYTLQRNNEDLSQGVLTQESLDNLYSQVFEGNTLVLYHDQEKSDIAGSFYVEDWFFDDINKESLDYILEISYDYSTEFSHNVEIDTSNMKLKPLETISQASPVKVTDIGLVPSMGGYYINFQIEDNGMSLDSKKTITLNNFEFGIGSNSLSDCLGYRDENGYRKEYSMDEIRLDSKNRKVIISCKASFEDDVKTNTKVFGSFDYTYFIEYAGTISLPKERAEN